MSLYMLRKRGYCDYYEVLGIEPSAGGAKIKKAYLRLAMKYHPDRNPGEKKAEELFKEMSEAYRALSDSQHRSVCDRNRRRSRQPLEKRVRTKH